jgi:pyridoxal phosphate enzyme (YggS family)
MPSSIAGNLSAIRQRMADAARRSGREPESVTLVAVSKTQPVAKVREAYEAGQRLFGENYVQEALPKIAQVPPDAVWHLIGHLQSNKVRHAVGTFACIQTVDSPKLALALEQRAQARGLTVEALVQVNWSHEATKSGVADPDALRRLVEGMRGYVAVRLRGLMAIPDPRLGESGLRSCFAGMRRLRDSLAAEFDLGPAFSELSMGMSQDFEWAIEEGATLVRIGTAIFGARA